MTKTLNVIHACAIQRSRGPRWLIQDLWAHEGVGILGGRPKSCKTWFALDLAISVASGTPALGKYVVAHPGSVLIFCAEDSPSMVRERLEGIASRRKLPLERIPVRIIVENTLRLDKPDDRNRLTETVARQRPRFLVLDPFVRLHRLDENSALEISGVLAYLRELQRKHSVAILVAHHARKTASAIDQMGLSLRGTGDLHAWGDSNLYLRKSRRGLELIVEHRHASPPDPISLELDTMQDTAPPQLVIVDEARRDDRVDDLEGRVLEALATKSHHRLHELRHTLKVKNERLVETLRQLEKQNRVGRSAKGWFKKTKEIGRSGGEGGDILAEE